MEKRLMLVLPEAVTLALLRARTDIYRHTGDVSVRFSPVALDLCPAEEPQLPRAACPSRPGLLVPSAGGDGIVLTLEGAEELLASLSLMRKPRMILSRQSSYVPEGLEAMEVDDWRIALCEFDDAEGVRTWRIREVRRLWKNNNPS